MDELRILVIESEPACIGYLEQCLRRAGFEVDIADTSQTLARTIDSDRHVAAVINFADAEGTALAQLEEASERHPHVPLLYVVDHDEASEAVQAMKAGAYSYVGKPYIEDQVRLVLAKALEQRQLEEEVRDLRGRANTVERPIICKSIAMRRLIETVDRVAASDSTVLIVGESGTGKELVARRIHARSRRMEQPFVAINCAALPETLLEAELFGHVKGAYTGAEYDRPGRFRSADGGTLFLDEISELSFTLQGKLLRALQERTVDVVGSDEPVPFDLRILTATNRDVRQRIAEGAFRDDLYYRLNVIELHVPPLRDRQEDIPLLARHFLRRGNGHRNLPLSDDVVHALCQRTWPGNVRELQNVCERIAILAEGGSIRVSDLPRSPRRRRAPRSEPARILPLKEQPLDLPPDGFSLVELERRVMKRALELKEWNVSETARFLQIPRHILTYRIQKHGLRRA